MQLTSNILQVCEFGKLTSELCSVYSPLGQNCTTIPRGLGEFIVTYGDNHQLMAALHTCPVGFTLPANKTTVCQENGTWTTPIPRCQGNPCIYERNAKASRQKDIAQMISFQIIIWHFGRPSIIGSNPVLRLVVASIGNSWGKGLGESCRWHILCASTTNFVHNYIKICTNSV